MVFGRERIEYKTPDQVRLMRRAGLVVAEALATVREATRPGMTTKELDAIAAKVIADAGAAPSFLGYHGFPGVICTSVNDEVIHGIPGSRVLAAGDLVSIDCGAIVEGWHGDSAISFVLGADGALDHRLSDDVLVATGVVELADVALVRATEAAMWAGIAALASAKRLNAVGEAVEAAIETAGELTGFDFGIVEEYVGHGIGSAMHQPPDVHNYKTSGAGARLRSGMCLAVEPMVTGGGPETSVLEDDWTVATLDGSSAAHWEHTTAITDGGIVVLTAVDGGAERLALYGVEPVALG